MTELMDEHEGQAPEAREGLEAAQPEFEPAAPTEATGAATPAVEPAATGAEPGPMTEPAGSPPEAEHAPEADAPESEAEDMLTPAPPVSGEALYGLDFSEEEVGRLAAGVAAEAAVAAEAVPPMSVQPAVEAPQEPAAVSESALAEDADDGRRWYVVHCYSGYENKVRHNLEQRIESMGMKGKIFDVVVPTEEELEVREGKRRTVERRVFPGYILVQMVMSEESWYVVRNTPGVTGFVGMGNEPTPLRPEEVAQIVKRMEAEAPRVKVTFKAGQKVRIIDGPFNDFIGTVDALDMEKAKVRVMVSFFGRETPVELDFLQVEKA